MEKMQLNSFCKLFLLADGISIFSVTQKAAVADTTLNFS